jgi:hypothetical protein
MQRILPGKMDGRVLKVMELFLTLNNLDDLLESTLYSGLEDIRSIVGPWLPSFWLLALGKLPY